jgi:predicted nucleotidyltransferase
MAKKEIIRIIKLFRRALEENGLRVEKIILYGSHAAGRANKDSDIDIAVVSPDFGKDRFDEGVLINRIAHKIDLRIEAIPFSSSSYQNDTWVPIIYEIRDKGIEIGTGKR